MTAYMKMIKEDHVWNPAQFVQCPTHFLYTSKSMKCSQGKNTIYMYT